MFLTNARQDGHFEPLTKHGAFGVKVKNLIDEKSGSERFFLRYYVLERDGRTPLDRHIYEHQVYVLSGQGKVQSETGEFTIKPGDAIFIASNERHQIVNVGDEALVFLCVKGAPNLYSGTPDRTDSCLC